MATTSMRDRMMDFRHDIDQHFFFQQHHDTTAPTTCVTIRKDTQLEALFHAMTYFQQRASAGHGNHIKHLHLHVSSKRLLVSMDTTSTTTTSTSSSDRDASDTSSSSNPARTSTPTITTTTTTPTNDASSSSSFCGCGRQRKFTELGQALALLQNLNFLSIDIHDVVANEIMLVPLLRGVAQSTTIMKLEITSTFLMTEDLTQQLGAVLQLFSNHLEVLWLRISTNYFIPSISTAIAALPKLKAISIAQASMSDSNEFGPLFTILTHHPTIDWIWLYNFQWNDSFTRAIVRYAREEQKDHHRRHHHHRTTTSSSTRKLLPRMAALKSLHLSPITLDSHQWKKSMSFLATNTTLHHISITRYRPSSNTTINGKLFLQTIQQLVSSSSGTKKYHQYPSSSSSSASSSALTVLELDWIDPLTIEEYIQVLQLLTTNQTLQKLQFHDDRQTLLVTNELQRSQLLVAAQRNYGLISYPSIMMRMMVQQQQQQKKNNDDGDDGSTNNNNYNNTKKRGMMVRMQELQIIGTLNKAGRKYLREDDGDCNNGGGGGGPTCKEKGVQVLIRVRHDLNAIYYHLLENPMLCG